MKYTVGDAPKLVEGQRVYVTIPQAGPDLIVKGKIVGIASIDHKNFPNYLVQCTDGQFPMVVEADGAQISSAHRG